MNLDTHSLTEVIDLKNVRLGFKIEETALKMIKLGFRKAIIMNCVSAPDRLIDALLKAHGKEACMRGRLKKSATILYPRGGRIEATNFMTIYLRLAKDPNNVVCIEAIIDAFEVYLDMHRKFRIRISDEGILDPTCAYILARDYRTADLFMSPCSNCGKHYAALYEENEKGKCPFCKRKQPLGNLVLKNLKIKHLAVSLVFSSLTLAGCASNQPPITVDKNPSRALQFARAMDLMTIKDDGPNYKIYNSLVDNQYIYENKVPVTAGQNAEAKDNPGHSADIIAGFATHTSLIPGLSLLSPKHPGLVIDGVPLIGSWSGLDLYVDGKQVSDIVKQSLPSFNGYAQSVSCQKFKTSTAFNTKHKGLDGSPVDIEPEKLPRPPINVPKTNMVIIQGFSACVFDIASRKDNLDNFKKLSTSLGPQRAVFVPGYQTHQPYVFYNGEQLSFAK